MTPRGRWALMLVALLLAGGQVAAELEAPEWLTVHKDQDGNAFLVSTGLSQARQAEILEQLGLQLGDIPSRPRYVDGDSSKGEGRRSVAESSFFRRELTRVPVADLQLGGHEPPERGSDFISILGTEASLRFERAYSEDGRFLGYNMTDSFGYRRERRINASRGIYSVQDEVGPIAITVMGKDGFRPNATAIGRLYSLEYLYDREDPPKQWTEKVLHRRDGTILGRWKASVKRPPRPGATARAPNGAMIAEWDEELYPEGMAVIASTTPYALVPAVSGLDTQVWRSVTLARVRMDPNDGACSDRLDYTDTEFRLWICHAPQEPEHSTDRHYYLITLPRVSAEEFLEEWSRK